LEIPTPADAERFVPVLIAASLSILLMINMIRTDFGMFVKSPLTKLTCKEAKFCRSCDTIKVCQIFTNT